MQLGVGLLVLQYIRFHRTTFRYFLDFRLSCKSAYQKNIAWHLILFQFLHLSRCSTHIWPLRRRSSTSHTSASHKRNGAAYDDIRGWGSIITAPSTRLGVSKANTGGCSFFSHAARLMCMKCHVRGAVESHVISITLTSTTGQVRLRRAFTTNGSGGS